MYEVRGTSPNFLIVDDCLHEERHVRVLVVGTGRVGTVSACIAAHIRNSPELSALVQFSEEPESAEEREDEGQPACHFPSYESEAPGEEMNPGRSIAIMGAMSLAMAMLAGSLSQGHQIVMSVHYCDTPAFRFSESRSSALRRPRRAKRNKQTNKKKNYRKML